MMSILEQRQIVESAFLPFSCRCTIETDGILTLEIRSPQSDQILLRADGIQRGELASSRSISQLVLRLRQQLITRETERPVRQMGSAA